MQGIRFVGVRENFGLTASRKQQPKVLSSVNLGGRQSERFQGGPKASHVSSKLFTGLACLAALLSAGCLVKPKQPHALPALKYSQGKIPAEVVWQACKDAQEAMLAEEGSNDSVDPEIFQLWKQRGMALSDLLETQVNRVCHSLKRDEDFAILVKGQKGQLLAIASREKRRFFVSGQNLEARARQFEAAGQLALTIYVDDNFRVAALKPFPMLKRSALQAEPSH